MILSSILFLLFVLLAITTLLFAFYRKRIVNNKNRIIKYFPSIVSLVIIFFTIIITLYYRIEQNQKVKEFNFLINESINIDTAINNLDKLSQPSDNYSKSKIDSILKLAGRSDSLNRIITNLRLSLISSNIFFNIKPIIKDSINLAYNSADSVQKVIKHTVKNLKLNKRVNSGYVYAGKRINGVWLQNNFTKAGNFTKELPKIGDTLIVIEPIFVRIGPTKYNEKAGWVNQELIGTLESGRKIIVLEVIRFPKEFYWLRF